MTTTVTDLEKYEGLKVVLTVSDPDTEGATKEIEGKAEKANAMGVLLKPKGKSGLELYEAGQVLEINYAPEKEKDLKAKPLKVVVYGNAKQHLVDRHGYKLSEINAMSEQDAFEFHGGLDHQAEDLGHFHQDKAEAEASESNPEVEGETDESEGDDSE